MQQQQELHDQEFSLYDNCERLQVINDKISALEIEKKGITAAIISDIGHAHSGEKSYEVGDLKVTCRTPVILSLDKKAYESGDVYLMPEFDPIDASTSYKINRARYESYLDRAPMSVREALDKLVTKKDGKASVVIR